MTIEQWSLVIQALALIPAYLIPIIMLKGIKVMDANAKDRARDSERKHEENMAALRALIERTSN